MLTWSKLRFIGVVFISWVLLYGCANQSVVVQPITVESKSFTKPPKGEISTAYIGEPLISEGLIKKIEVITLNKKDGVIPKLGALSSTYHPSGDYRLVGKYDNYFVYQHAKSFWYGTKDCYPQIFKDQNGQYYMKKSSELKKIPKEDIEIREELVKEFDNYKQTLIFMGKNSSILNFTYREFINNLARPAFTMNPKYDAGEKIITFKGASFEIIECNNQFIKYKIISGFKR